MVVLILALVGCAVDDVAGEATWRGDEVGELEEDGVEYSAGVLGPYRPAEGRNVGAHPGMPEPANAADDKDSPVWKMESDAGRRR